MEPIKRHGVAGWIRKRRPVYADYRTLNYAKLGTCRLKIKGWKMIFQANRTQKTAGAYKVDFKLKMLKPTHT